MVVTIARTGVLDDESVARVYCYLALLQAAELVVARPRRLLAFSPGSKLLVAAVLRVLWCNSLAQVDQSQTQSCGLHGVPAVPLVVVEA